ncbi:MAG: response regulator [Candidatus Krumholzibacteria bacterium]|nr:response regulator [Candidatus Krumholzibacteria bacterium]
MRILAVDNDGCSLELIKRVLTQKGHEVVTADSGEKALSILFKSSVRMVIADQTMQGMGGLELCRHIRSRGFHSYVFIVLMTQRKETADVIEGLKAGADEFLCKPLDATELDLRVGMGERILSTEYHQIAIFTLAKLAESRDPETGLHLDRIREYSKLLGIHLARQKKFADILPYSEIEIIYHTSVLHDIGKVGIPDTILLKPGPLDAAEFEVMKTHTIIGGKTLGQALAQYPDAEFLEVARNTAFWHHERYDGSGYPHALAGEDIPLCARIVSLADVYDALTSKRPYKKAYPHEAAREIMIEKRGRHFDPDIVDAFIEAEAAFAEVSKRLAATDSQGAEVPAAGAAAAK